MIREFFHNKLTLFKFIILSLKNRGKTKTKEKSNIILIEFNAFHVIHVVYSVVCNFFLKKDNNIKLIAYYNYDVLVSNPKRSYFNNLAWFFGDLLWINNFGVYKSFGVIDFVRPNINNDYEKEVNKNLKKIKKLSKSEILKFKIDGILIGDLIYDTFIKRYQLETINLKDKNFHKLIYDFLLVYYFWSNYLKDKRIKKIIGVHTVYSYAIILRIAISYKIEALIINDECISRLSKKNYFANTDFTSYSKNFLKLNKKVKKKGLEISKKKLNKRLGGHAGIKYDLLSKKSSFHDKKLPRQIVKSTKLKILVCTRNLFDAVHVFGSQLFVDNLEWLECLGKLSNLNDYDWYIKTHRLYEGKFKKYQPISNSTIYKIIKRYPKLKILKPDYSHKQIVSEGIDFVITQHGSVGYEYAYLGIPVINSSINNPQTSYNFNINPRTKFEFVKIIKNLKKIKFLIKKRDIEEFYFMRNIYQDKCWFFDDQSDLMKFIQDWNGKYNYKIYEYSLSYLNDKENIKRIENNLTNFFKKHDHIMSIEHTLKKL